MLNIALCYPAHVFLLITPPDLLKL